MHEAFNDLWAAFRKTEERLKHSRRLIQDRSHLIQELRTKVPTATTAATTIQYAPEDPTLPSPWRGLIDGSLGSLYYWNPETNQTQYERPCEEAAQHPLRTLTSSDDSVHPNPQPFHHSPRYPLTVPSSATSVPSNPPLIHPTISHPTQPIYLHRKQLRVLRRRVSMAAIRRLFKATRKPYLISTVGKDSKTQVNRKNGLWVVKTKSGFFPDFVEELCQLSMDPTAPTDTSHLAATNPSSLVLVSDVTEQHEVLSSVAVADEVSLASPKPTSDVVVCNGITSCASFACTHAVSPELVRLDLLPSLTESKPSQIPLEADRVKVSTVDSIYSTFAPGADVGVEVTNVDVNVTDIGSILGDMLEPLILGTVKKYGSSLDGFICNEDNHCPASTLVQQVTMKDKFYKQDFVLVYRFCKLGNFDKPEGHCMISLWWDEVHLSPKTVAMRKQLWELISKPNSSFGVSEPNLESPGDSMKGQLGLSHCYITLKATAESEFLIVSGTPPITVHQLRAPLLKFERQLHYEIIDFVVLANDYSKLAFFSADCSPFPHENYRQHCSLWNSILGKVMVCDCWSCALLFAAPYDTLVAQIKNGALYCIDTILQSFPDIVRDNRRSVLVDVGGATLLMVELNRVLRLRGSFVRSAIPAYHKFHADIGIRGAMSEFTKSNCWDLMVLRTDGPKKVVVVLFWNPSTPECYNARARSFVTADPLFTGSSMIVLGYSDEPIVCVSQVFSCQLASESFTSCYMSMEIAMMKASHPPKVVIATNCQQLTISVVQIDAYHHSDPSLMVVSVHSFSSHYRNNEPLFVISCNERQIVRSPQRVIPTSKMEGDSVTLLVHVDPSLIFETEKNHYKGCSKTHMLESTQRRLMLLQESVLLKAASPRVLRTHPLVLPSDNSIHPNLACILSKHHSLVVEAAIMMRQFFTSAVLYTRICSTDFLMNISEFYPLRYSSDPLENGVVWMTYMQKTFQTDHKEEPLVTASSSNFNSPTHAIVRKLVSLLLMVAIHSSPPLRDNILREDGCCPFFLGNTMVIYINEQLSLKSKKQGLDIGYGVYNGNYSSPVSSSLHLSDFMITRLIAFGFGAMDFGDLALVPHKLFSILMWSNEAFLVILLSASIHFRLLVFVIASHLLHCPTREALQIISIMPHSHNWLPTSNSHESVYLSALIHTWQVTTGDGINFGATLTNITALDMTYSTSWYLPWFTSDPNASQKTFGAMVAYLEELKVKLFDDSHFGPLQTVDLEEYGDSWSLHRERHIPAFVVTLNAKNRLVADVSSMEHVWNPGSEFFLCDCMWLMQEHVFTVNTVDEMLIAMTDQGEMGSAEVLGTHFSVIRSRPEDMPLFKGGGMLGPLCYTYILLWASVLIYLNGLFIGFGSGHIVNGFLGLVVETTI